MDTNRILGFMTKHNIIYAVFVDLSTNNVDHFGNKDDLPGNTDLFNSLFGDNEEIQLTNEYLNGMIMPRVWAQGNLECVLIKPNDNLLIGLFFINNDKKSTYFFSVMLNNELIELLAK